VVEKKGEEKRGRVVTRFRSFLYGLVLRDIPTRAPSELVELGFDSRSNASGVRATYLPYRIFDALQHEITSFSGISGWQQWNVSMQETTKVHYARIYGWVGDGQCI
jgi:hypothetical protein